MYFPNDLDSFGNSDLAKQFVLDYNEEADSNRSYAGNQQVLKRLFNNYKDNEEFKYYYLDKKYCFWEFEEHANSLYEPPRRLSHTNLPRISKISLEQRVKMFERIISGASIIAARRPGQFIAADQFPEILKKQKETKKNEDNVAL